MKQLQHSRFLSDKSMNLEQVVIITLLFCYVALVYTGIVVAERSFVFDDSFITYRYAKNLALGYGITWNPGEAPVEGYTNYLLVIVLAPFIQWGLSPLWVTRAFSLIAAFSMGAFLWNISRKDYGAVGLSASIVPITFFLATRTALLSMVGLETVIYAGVLSAAFMVGCRYFNTRKLYFILSYGLLLFAASLLRPEALLSVIPFTIVTIYSTWKAGLPWTFNVRLLGTLALSLGFPLSVYLLWKYLHFGSIVPNPFYIKLATADSSLLVSSGLASIRDFLLYHYPLVITALASFTFVKIRTTERSFAALTVLFYIMFFTQVDTLMDIYGRFLYPMTFFLVYLSIPTLVRMTQHVLAVQWPSLVKISFILALFLFFIGPDVSAQTAINYNNILRGKDNYVLSDSLMQKEYRVAMALRRFEGIEQVRLAFGDAGVIPYFTGALHLNVVGLNDRFIARERDINKLVDYFFSQQPDLIMHPANKDYSWITYGHGPLGNVARWSGDKRWDDYDYIGTITTSGAIYDIHLFLRRDMREFRKLKAFLLASVVDGYYTEFPIAIGTYTSDGLELPVWVPRANAW